MYAELGLEAAPVQQVEVPRLRQAVSAQTPLPVLPGSGYKNQDLCTGTERLISLRFSCAKYMCTMAA